MEFGVMSGNSSGEPPPNIDSTPIEKKSVPVPSEILDSVSKTIQEAGLNPDKAKLVTVSVMEAMMKIHHGPLPPAEEFIAYNTGHPGAAKTILDMAVNSQNHHYKIESRRQIFDLVLNISGQAGAVLTVGMMLYNAYIMVLAKEPWVAGVVLTCTGIAGGVAVWLRGNGNNGAEQPHEKRPEPSSQKKKPRR